MNASSPKHRTPRRKRRLLPAVIAATASLLVTVLGSMVLAPSADAVEETLFSGTTTPQHPVDADVQAVELGVRFQVTTRGTITGVRYYGTAENTGPHTGSLWSSGGTRLATATFPESDGIGWQRVSFASPVHISPGRTYVASYRAPSGHYVDDPDGFSQGLTRGDILTSPGAGVYAYGDVVGFPTRNWRNSNYYVDVTFVPDAPGTDGAPSDGADASDAVDASGAPQPTQSSDVSAPASQAPTRSDPAPGSATSTASATPSQTPSATVPLAPASASASAGSAPASATPTARGCALMPSACGYPDATNTGVVAGTTLATRSGGLTITADGTVLQNTVVNGTLTVAADNVTLRNVRVVETGDTWGIGLEHTKNTTIDRVQVMRGDGDRLEVGIKDVYGDATGTTITHSDISGTSTGIQTHEGVIQDNYIHDLAMDSGDHVNGFTSNGATTPLTIDHNTVFNPISQTDAISLFQDFGLEANRTITDNLIAGGGYTLYAGSGSKGTTHDIIVSGNRFSRLYFPDGGSYGPATAYDAHGTGNVWTDNIWDDTGASVTP